MTKRLDILAASLVKKEHILEDRFDAYFSDVKSANGQPLNDKRCGAATFKRWDKKSDAIGTAKAEIEKTERAISREQDKINAIDSALALLPSPIVALVESGVLRQWRRHPSVLFVEGVDNARIQWKNGKLVYRYLSGIKCKDQYAKFRDVVGGLIKELNEMGGDK